MRYEPSIESVRAMHRFASSVRGGEAVLEVHVVDHDGVLPHVLMADFRRLFVDLVDDGEDERVREFLDAIEVLASSDDEGVQNVVGVSFIEDLVQGADARELAAIAAMKPLIGPATADSLAISEEFT